MAQRVLFFIHKSIKKLLKNGKKLLKSKKKLKTNLN